MKSFVKIISLLLVLSTVFSLAACDKIPFLNDKEDSSDVVSKTDAELIVGSWRAEIDNKVLFSTVETVYEGALKGTENLSLTAKVGMLFTNDGKFSYLVVDVEEYNQKAVAFCDVVFNNIYAANFEAGLTTDTLEVYRATTLNGKTSAQFFGADAASLFVENYYKCEDGKCTFAETVEELQNSEDVINIEVTENTLKFLSTESDNSNDSDAFDLFANVTFKKD